mmetsp:Transcript_17518/g.29416  ORF Transcript_17518/g.29416 Transcript_17518/m.29416 type:complete len:298 (-) Transcript_17518:587-1480(-)
MAVEEFHEHGLNLLARKSGVELLVGGCALRQVRQIDGFHRDTIGLEKGDQPRQQRRFAIRGWHESQLAKETFVAVTVRSHEHKQVELALAAPHRTRGRHVRILERHLEQIHANRRHAHLPRALLGAAQSPLLVVLAKQIPRRHGADVVALVVELLVQRPRLLPPPPEQLRHLLVEIGRPALRAIQIAAVQQDARLQQPSQRGRCERLRIALLKGLRHQRAAGAHQRNVRLGRLRVHLLIHMVVDDFNDVGEVLLLSRRDPVVVDEHELGQAGGVLQCAQVHLLLEEQSACLQPRGGQ